MNTVTFQRAQAEYAGKDYEAALQTYTECLQDDSTEFEPGEIGLLYHRIGNCLMKIKDFEEAVHAYTQAASDNDYEQVGAVNCNLGTSYASLHDYEDAVRHFEIAVSDARYTTPYRAYERMGSALMRLGKSAEAGSAYRSAALDEANPNPAKSLLNLGICFMALDRPADAVSSYESALQFNMDSATRNKLHANLGQAYTATNQMQQAVDSFERALADKTYYLNDAASVDYQRAVGAVAQGTAVMDPISLETEQDLSGLDVSGDGAPVYHETDFEAAAADPYNYANSYGVQDQYESGDDRFFNATDEELEKWSRGVAKQDRKRRNVGLKVFIFFIVVILLVAAAGVFAYSQGYGYPTQEQVVQKLFADKDASLFASDISDSDRQTMLDPITADSDIQIDGVERSMTTSKVYTTCTTEQGGNVHYQITLSRAGIGWDVSRVELYFPSQN